MPKPISSDHSPLELCGDEFRKHVEIVVSRLMKHLDTLPDQDAWAPHTNPTDAVAAREAGPGEPDTINNVIDRFFSERLQPSYNPASGGYMAYVPGGGIPHAAIADLIAGIINKYVTVWSVAPGLANLEADVIHWLCQLVNFPETAGGFLTTGGSMANWSAVVTARRTMLGDDFSNATIYTSNQTHHSIQKAAVLAGFPEKHVRLIASDSNHRIDIAALTHEIAADRNVGLRPFLIAAHAGTTNTGAIDPLKMLAEICNRQNLWLHIDAAYGGFFCLTKRGRQALESIELADSITLDPHKGLFLPYGTGCLLIRDRQALRNAHLLDANYLPPLQNDSQRVDFCAISPELSRDFRALRIWLPLKLFGWDTFMAYLDEKLDLCQFAFRAISEMQHIEIISAPQLSTFAFRLNPDTDSLSTEQLNQLNERFLKLINHSRRFFLSSTTIDGQLVIRICILCFRTHLNQVQDCVEQVRDAITPTLESSL